jgi:branched-chain amino acid transport system permease protein
MLGQLLWNGLVAGSIYALTALGFAVIYRTVRFFHFAHGVVYAVGAYLAYFFLEQLRFPTPLAFFLPAQERGALAGQ